MALSENTMTRFGGIARLYGVNALERFSNAHVAVVGIGGVGSWCVEALARSGIGKISIMDLDEICVTNINRQLHAMDGNIGQQKTDAMAERIHAINPECVVQNIQSFYSERTSDAFFAHRFDFVIDAIDRVKEKSHLLAHCKASHIPIVSCGAAGGLRDPSRIQSADISKVTNDKLISQVRNKLRSLYHFPKGSPKKASKKFGIEAVFSTEQAVFPQCDGTVSTTRPQESESQNMRLNCANGYGSITHITATFGFFAVEKALHHIAQ